MPDGKDKGKETEKADYSALLNSTNPKEVVEKKMAAVESEGDKTFSLAPKYAKDQHVIIVASDLDDEGKNIAHIEMDKMQDHTTFKASWLGNDLMLTFEDPTQNAAVTYIFPEQFGLEAKPGIAYVSFPNGEKALGDDGKPTPPNNAIGFNSPISGARLLPELPVKYLNKMFEEARQKHKEAKTQEDLQEEAMDKVSQNANTEPANEKGLAATAATSLPAVNDAGKSVV